MEFKPKHILTTSLDIVDEYAASGLKLTARQLYYQFVARGLMANDQKTYKRIVNTLSKYRMTGLFPLDAIVDRTRTVHLGRASQSMSPKGALDAARQERQSVPERYIWRDRWYGQRNIASVWVEKEALAGVFEGPCNQAGVSWFACKGYPSHAALYEWLRHMESSLVGGRGLVTVYYFGDHDPDGLQIPLSAAKVVDTMIDLLKLEFKVRWVQKALTKAQIEHHNPPPFPAKTTSSRYASYIEKTGMQDAWELDALEPRELQRLILECTDEAFNRAAYDAMQDQVHDTRFVVRERLQQDGFYEPEY